MWNDTLGVAPWAPWRDIRYSPPRVGTDQEGIYSAPIVGKRIRSRRVLVVGWGFLGAAVGTRMRDEGMEVIALTRSETARTHAARLRGLEMVVGDAGDPLLLEGAMAGVDHVVYAAGGLLPAPAAERPLHDVTSTLSPLLAILERLRSSPSASLVYLSSGGTVYGNPMRVPAREGDPTRPISAYGVSRLAGELYAEMYGRTYGFPVQIFRIANVYGPGQSPDHSQGAVAVFLHRMATARPIDIVGDGSAIRDYVHVSDVADVITRVVSDRIDVGTVNLGSGRGISVRGLAQKIGRMIGVEPLLRFLPPRAHDVAAITLDIGKLRSLIDYAPIDLHQGLEMTWRHVAAGPLARDRVLPPTLAVLQVPAENLGLEQAAPA